MAKGNPPPSQSRLQVRKANHPHSALLTTRNALRKHAAMIKKGLSPTCSSAKTTSRSNCSASEKTSARPLSSGPNCAAVCTVSASLGKKCLLLQREGEGLTLFLGLWDYPCACSSEPRQRSQRRLSRKAQRTASALLGRSRRARRSTEPRSTSLPCIVSPVPSSLTLGEIEVGLDRTRALSLD